MTKMTIAPLHQEDASVAVSICAHVMVANALQLMVTWASGLLKCPSTHLYCSFVLLSTACSALRSLETDHLCFVGTPASWSTAPRNQCPPARTAAGLVARSPVHCHDYRTTEENLTTQQENWVVAGLICYQIHVQVAQFGIGFVSFLLEVVKRDFGAFKS